VNRFTFTYDTFLPARLHFAVSRRRYQSLSRRPLCHFFLKIPNPPMRLVGVLTRRKFETKRSFVFHVEWKHLNGRIKRNWGDTDIRVRDTDSIFKDIE